MEEQHHGRSEQSLLYGPEEELEAVFTVRVKPFKEIGDAEKIRLYEQARNAAVGHLKQILKTRSCGAAGDGHESY